MLRQFGNDMEIYARICERHTGSGLTASEIISGNMPLPQVDLLPETLEEKLICLADKFFSKSGDFAEKPLQKIRTSTARFGSENAARLEALLALFKLNS